MTTLLDGMGFSYFNSEGYVNAVHPSLTLRDSAYGQCFKVKATGEKYKLTRFVVSVRKPQAGTGHLQAKLYALTGTYGTDGKPTGSVLAASELFDVADLNSDFQEVAFNFVDAEQYEMLKDQAYCMHVELVDEPAEYKAVWFKENEGDNPHDGNQFTYREDGWVAWSDYDVCFLVYGTLVEPPPPTPKILTMVNDGNGSIVPSEGEHEYDHGTEVILTATPDEDYTFDYWLRFGEKWSINPFQITIYTDQTITAYFKAIPPPSEGEWTTPDSVHSKCGETGDDVATNAIDGHTGTYWRHNVVCFHWIILNMGAVKKLTKVRLYQYSGTRAWGQAVGVLVYVSNDVEDWGDPVYEGILSGGAVTWYESDAFSKVGRYIKFVSKADSNEQRIRELEVFAEPPLPVTPLLAKKLGSNLAVLLRGEDKGKIVILV